MLIPTLRKVLTFDEKYQMQAEKSLRRVLKSHLLKVGEKKGKKKWKEPLWVGVHVRQADHTALQEEFGMKPLKASYYLQAMDLFRGHYGKKRGVLFALVGDNLAWVEAALLPR